MSFIVPIIKDLRYNSKKNWPNFRHSDICFLKLIYIEKFKNHYFAIITCDVVYNV